MANKYSRPHLKQSSRLPKYVWLLAPVAIVVIFGALELTNTISLFKESKPTSGTIPSKSRSDSPPPEATKDKEIESSKPESTAAPASPTPKQESQPTTPSGEAPITPYGSFVSNHRPNLDGDPAPSTMASVCNTTPGASCYIEFTNKDGIVKKLATQTADSSGAAYWQWDVKEAGFSVGSWEVKAIATLNGKTTTAKDIQNIEVES